MCTNDGKLRFTFKFQTLERKALYRGAAAPSYISSRMRATQAG